MTFNWTGGIADYDTPTAWGGSLPGNNSTAVILAGMPIITAMDAASLPTSLTFQIGATLASLPLGSTAVFQPGAGLELDDATLLSGVTIDVNLTGGSPFEGAGLVAAGNAASDAIINIGAMDVLGIGVNPIQARPPTPSPTPAKSMWREPRPWRRLSCLSLR